MKLKFLYVWFSLVTNNFVKIDIRKKTYQRGVSKLTGAAYKRKQWKQRTSFEVTSNTSWKKNSSKKICFRCGREGHWAKFCKGPKKKVDPFRFAVVITLCSFFYLLFYFQLWSALCQHLVALSLSWNSSPKVAFSTNLVYITQKKVVELLEQKDIVKK